MCVIHKTPLSTHVKKLLKISKQNVMKTCIKKQIFGHEKK